MKIRKNIMFIAGLGLAAVSATSAHAAGGLTFIISGDTFNSPYTITNTSTAGERVTGFGISLIAPFGFDTVNGGFGIDGSSAFAPFGGSAALTGYTGPASFADGSTSIAFTFNDFQVGEAFSWLIDVDRSNINAQVIGNELIGSTGYADFSNGLRGLGVFQAVAGNAQASQFTITTFTTTPAGVPEPATWATLVVGFGLIGSAMRRRQTVAVKYA
jgi:PEP-CTERM motif